MAIYLIVGQPRHGKSQFAAKMAYDYHEKISKYRSVLIQENLILKQTLLEKSIQILRDTQKNVIL
jgi:hypothetical protein